MALLSSSLLLVLPEVWRDGGMKESPGEDRKMVGPWGEKSSRCSSLRTRERPEAQEDTEDWPRV